MTCPDLNPPSSADENLSSRPHSVSLLLTHPSIPGSNLCPPAPRSVSHCLSVELMNLSWGVLFLPACRCRRQSALQADSRAARQAQVRGSPHHNPPFITDSHAEPVNAWTAAQRQSDIVIPARRIPAVPPLLWLSPGFAAPPSPKPSLSK